MELHVGEIMNPDPITVPSATPLAAVAATMGARGAGAALVVDGPELRGIVTERDLARAAAAGAPPADTAVDAWMTRDPVTVAPGEDLTHALDRMLERGFRHLPVRESGALLGIVSLRRLVRAASVRRVDPWTP